MKKIGFISFFVLVVSNIYGQNGNDSIYRKFTQCIYEFFTDLKRDKSDSIIVLFRNNPVSFNKSYQEGGIYYSISYFPVQTDSGSLDKSKANKNIFFDRTTSFQRFLNSMIYEADSSKFKISIMSGIWAYVYMPNEEWEQFYFDYLLGYDSLYVNPVIDILENKQEFITHYRYRIECDFIRGSSFFIRKRTLIQEKKIAK